MSNINEIWNSDEGTLDVSAERVAEIKKNINMLANKLTNKEPDMPYLLKKIHADIKGNPELAYILEPEEIGVIVASAEAYTDIKIVQDIVHNKRVTKNDIAAAKVDDF